MVRVVGLTKRLGAFQLQGISFELATGDYGVLLGPTGCGKTVLLETIVGINRPEAGEVWLDGQNVTLLPPERRGIGFVYQRSMLFPHLSVRANIAYGLRYHGVERSERAKRVERVADLLAISALLDRDTAALSGGEMQKVAVARALAIEPRVLLLDEPLAALDPLAKEALRAEIAALHHQLGTTILHVTHDQEEARILGHTLGILRSGRLLQFGPKDDVFERPNSPFVARFVGTENVFEGTAVREGSGVRIALACGSLLARGAVAGRVGLCVRPEWVLIGPANAPAALQNRLEGTVAEISDRGPVVRYEVATRGNRFVVLQTKRDYAASGLSIGQAVALGFEPEAVHVFPWRDEER
ncbi:MAG TPA: ABC transporter ATP-binding protein [Planctomycetota bacterium]|mgnify:FL=1|nr:ABC transporter ATP-binding protein [Planctomycetota bacterium]